MKIVHQAAIDEAERVMKTVPGYLDARRLGLIESIADAVMGLRDAAARGDIGRWKEFDAQIHALVSKAKSYGWTLEYDFVGRDLGDPARRYDRGGIVTNLTEWLMPTPRSRVREYVSNRIVERNDIADYIGIEPSKALVLLTAAVQAGQMLKRDPSLYDKNLRALLELLQNIDAADFLAAEAEKNKDAKLTSYAARKREDLITELVDAGWPSVVTAAVESLRGEYALLNGGPKLLKAADDFLLASRLSIAQEWRGGEMATKWTELGGASYLEQRRWALGAALVTEMSKGLPVAAQAGAWKSVQLGRVGALLADDNLVPSMGGAVKALSGGRIGGYLVRFSDQYTPDLAGDYFTAKTDLGDHDSVRLMYQHGQDEVLGQRVIGKAKLTKDSVGAWVEAQLNLADEYEKALYEMAEAGRMGFSSGSAGHLVQRRKVGKANEILSWPIIEASLTPTPAERLNRAQAI